MHGAGAGDQAEAEPRAAAAFGEIAVVGAGLLGGSLGLAARARGVCRTVVGVGRSPMNLKAAQDLGAVERFETDLARGVARADLVVICTPVRHIAEVLAGVVAAAKPGAIVTDVGSTKASIVAAGEAAEAARADRAVRFVGSHPMAGSEKSGVAAASADLYEDANCFVTKTPRTDAAAFAAVCGFWRALGGRVVVARPERHDRLVSLVSHLPHLVAVALVEMAEASGEDKNLIKGIIGNGFRDATRIATGSPEIWGDIFGENRAELERARRLFEGVFARLCDAATGPDSGAGRPILESAGEFREFLDGR